MTNKRSVPSITVLTVASIVLLALNFLRDVNTIEHKYDWETVRRGVVHRGIATNGVMEAARVAEIKSEVDEIVEKKLAQEGDAVREGQQLVLLTRSKTQLEYDQKRNALLNAEADVRKTTREVSVQKKLLKNMAVSRQQVEEAEQALNRARATLGICRQEFGMAQRKIDSTVVRSPMNGVVLKDFTKIGAAVSPGKEIITVGDISKFIVRAKVDELDIQQISIGQNVDIKADAFPDQTMRGKVASIATQAERETFAKIEVLINITDAGKLSLKHNLSVRINVLTEDIPDALSIPAKCILKKDGDTAWVIVRNGMRMVRRRRIRLGKPAGDRVQVLSGIGEGEAVGIEKATDTLP